MPKICIDLTGKRFGRWLVEARDPLPTSRNNYWLVTCDCGNEGSVRYSELVSEHSTQCSRCSRQLWSDAGTRASMKRRGFTWGRSNEET